MNLKDAFTNMISTYRAVAERLDESKNYFNQIGEAVFHFE